MFWRWRSLMAVAAVLTMLVTSVRPYSLDCSMGPFTLVGQEFTIPAPFGCGLAPPGTPVWCPAILSDELATRMVQTMLQSYCTFSPPIMWIGPLTSMVYYPQVTPATGILNNAAGIRFALYQLTVVEPYEATQTATIPFYVQPFPAVITSTTLVVVTGPPVTATEVQFETSFATAVVTVFTVTRQSDFSETTVSATVSTQSTSTLVTTDDTTFITLLVTAVASTVDTRDTVVEATTITMVSLTDGAVTDTLTVSVTATSCPSDTTTETTTSTRSVTRITSTETRTVRTASTTTTATTTTGPCSTVTRTEERTCTVLDTTTVSQTVIEPSAKMECFKGQRLTLCGGAGDGDDDDGGLVLVMSKVPKEQVRCVCESIGKTAADIDDDGVAAASRLIHRCLGPREYAWIGSIGGKTFKDQCMAVQAGANRDSRVGARLGRPQPCSAFLPILCR